MANEQNLMPIEQVNARKTREERVESARKAGKASGAAKRRKKSMAETINYLMSLPVSPNQTKIREAMTRFGIPEDEQTQRTAAVFSMMLEISKGNVGAFRALNDAEAREADQKLKKSQFAYQKKRDQKMDESEAAGSSLADLIENAYRERESDDETDDDDGKITAADDSGTEAEGDASDEHGE